MDRRKILTAFRAALTSVGYDDRFVVADYHFADFGQHESHVGRIPLAAFSSRPFTYRNACIGVAVADSTNQGVPLVMQHHALGAPLVFEVCETEVQPWAMGTQAPKPIGDPFRVDSLAHVFGSHRDIWNPDAIGRIKSAAAVRPNRQLDFFDLGYFPVLTEFFQTKLKDLLERAFSRTAISYEQVHGQSPEVTSLFPYLFRFVAAKIFMDRADARGWDGLSDPLEILRKAEHHSGSDLLEKLPKPFFHPQVLEQAWLSVSRTLNFQNLSVPDLAFIYESSFINEQTRRELGVHSTPVGLANYIIEHLPWERLPIDERVVFEPFCGHGVFLASALTRLGVDLAPGLTGKQRHAYFRRMLIGVEKDPLAIEVCRLVLTLSDYPNENRWQLHQDDVFSWAGWTDALQEASVVVANPPYESFSREERQRVSAIKATPPAEMLHRLMRAPPRMLGLVLPQSFLSSPFYQDANRSLAQHYDDISIVELPRIFQYADNETIALIASGKREQGSRVAVRYAEVLPEKTRPFFEDFHVSQERRKTLAVPSAGAPFTLWIPAKANLWERLSHLDKLGELATIRRGVHWRPRTDGQPRTAPRKDVVSDSEKREFHIGVEKMAGNLSQFRLCRLRYLSLRDEDQDARTRAHKYAWSKRKVVCNVARFERRSPWRIAAWADTHGLAFSQQFFAIWPRDGISEFALAALLCSPLANAFSWLHDLERHNHNSTLERLPIPPIERVGPFGDLHRRGKELQALLDPANQDGTVDEARIREALLRADAAVLEAYELSAHAQRELLDQFSGWKRPVGVRFPEYFPEHFSDSVTLKDLMIVRYDWEATNERRCDLIDKELSPDGLTTGERGELDRLQNLADLLIRLEAPYPTKSLDGLISQLKAEGKWSDSI